MIRKIRESEQEEGFTLIELLVVVIIIGILAAIAIPVFLNQRENAQRSALQASVTNAVSSAQTQLIEGDAMADVVTEITGTINDHTITMSGAAGSTTDFCVQATNGTLTYGQEVAENTLSNVAEGTCTAGVFTAAP